MLQIVNRYKTLATSRISALPVVVLMPWSACNCRCAMCDIWKDNKRIQSLGIPDIERLLASFNKLGTKWVTLSGGEPLLHPDIKEICRMLKKSGMKVSMLSTGLTAARQADCLINFTDELILSLDGPPPVHNEIRNISKAYEMLADSVETLKTLNPHYKISTRTVIQKANFRLWKEIINTVRELGVNQCSFLPADVSTAVLTGKKAGVRIEKMASCLPRQSVTKWIALSMRLRQRMLHFLSQDS